MSLLSQLCDLPHRLLFIQFSEPARTHSSHSPFILLYFISDFVIPPLTLLPMFKSSLPDFTWIVPASCTSQILRLSQSVLERAVELFPLVFFFFNNFEHLATYLFLNINQLDELNFYNKFISSLYMFRAHVLDTCRGLK